jgi:protein gp37
MMGVCVVADNTAIEWTHRPGTKGETWNPTVGCSILSPGCTHCYAMGEAARQVRCAAGLKRATHYEGTVKTVKGRAVWTGKINLAPDHILMKPLRWRQPHTVFVNSMSDLFHESIPDEWIDRVFAVMALSPQHTFQVLTKRAERMRAYFDGCLNPPFDLPLNKAWLTQWHRRGGVLVEIERLAELGFANKFPGVHQLPLPNVWLGVSAERQQEADERIPLLLQTPAAVRFISAEPLLGHIDLLNIRLPEKHLDALTGRAHYPGAGSISSKTLQGNRLDWIIVGGESGPNARPMHPDWARSLRDQCAAAVVPYFLKQWGEWAPVYCEEDGSFEYSHELTFLAPDGKRIAYEDIAKSDFPNASRLMERVGKKAAGRLLDSTLHNEFPQVKEVVSE